jgi:hypothetical protein
MPELPLLLLQFLMPLLRLKRLLLKLLIGVWVVILLVCHALGQAALAAAVFVVPSVTENTLSQKKESSSYCKNVILI